MPWWQRTVVDVPAQQPALESHDVVILPDDEPADAVQTSLARTQWAKETTGGCPGCGSANYARHPDQPRARPRCFDCGYPISQSGSGLAPQGEKVGPVAPARQTRAASTNNFRPHEIVHHMHPQQKG